MKMKFKKHVFICTNDKPAPKKCCSSEKGMEIVKAFQESLKEKGLNTEIRAQRAGCLDACAHGPSIVVYPEGVYYGKVTPEDVEEIVTEHHVGYKVVDRLAIKFD
jgi:(2Fe-2S) ferredoxin